MGDKKATIEFSERSLQFVSNDSSQTDSGRQTIRTNVPERLKALKVGQ